MKLLSRTINETIFSVKALNILTNEVRDIDVNVGSMDFKDDSKALSYIKARHDSEAVKAVCIMGKKNYSRLYVLPEDVFLKYAKDFSDMKEARSYYKKTMGVEIEEEEA